MSIPIIDINAGDTMSTMVDKINYNFTLVSLKGGGPSGIQGIQGIRGELGVQGDQGPQGENGSSIYSTPNPSVPPMRPGDINIYDGVIQQVQDDETISNIVDLNLSVQSPFGISNSNTINPQTSFETYPIVFGMGTASSLNGGVSSNSVLHIVGTGGKDFVRFYPSGQSSDSSCYGSILIDNNSLKITAKNGKELVLSGSPSTPDTHNIKISTDGIYIPSRIYQNAPDQTASYIVATKVTNGIIDKDAGWAVKKSTMFPVPAAGEKNSLGKYDVNDTTCMENVFFRKDSNIVLTGSTVLTSVNTIKQTSLKFVSRENPGGNDIDIMWMSKYGIALGGLTQTNTPNNLFDTSSFSVKIMPPASNNSASLFLSSRKISVPSIIATSKMVSSFSSGNYISTPVGSADYSIKGTITMASGINVNEFVNNKYTNLIGCIKKSDGGKCSNDTLHIHGADGASNTGCDVVITGGNTTGTTNLSYVGGDVYISGGSALRYGTSVDSDLRRAGNVIIGINPLNHSDCFTTKNYTSTGSDGHNSEMIPDQIGFYDINNVAIHGNKVTLDSDANFRMATKKYTTGQNSATSPVLPYVSDPKNATMSVSGINTMLHYHPVLLEQEDICSHQFMSGVMRRIIRIQYVNGGFVTSFVNPTIFEKPSGNQSYFGSDSIGSVYFITDQVWQKIGNIVNVNAFGRWVANKPNESTLYHITDRMFYRPAQNGNATDFSQDWVVSSSPYCYNQTLGKLLLKRQNEYLSLNKSNPGSIGQPMTTFMLPFTVNNMNVLHCYGNGNIYTETPRHSKQYSTTQLIPINEYRLVKNGELIQTNPIVEDTVYNFSTFYDMEPSGSVIMSTPVTVGAYYKKQDYDFGSGFGSAESGNANNGGNGAIHNNVYNSTAFTKNLSSIGMLSTDERMSASSDSSHIWNESKFTITEDLQQNSNIVKYGYIYPEMLAEYGNKSNWKSDGSEVMQGKYMRPCVGMYTWISLNYSYCIMNNFNYNYTGIGYSSNYVTTSMDDHAELMPGIDDK